MKRTLTIEDMHLTASLKNGKCLSTEYVSVKKHLLWQCGECKHEWYAKPNNIRNGKWCPSCAGNLPLCLEDAQYLAKLKNGQCLSVKYINSHKPMVWTCSKGHVWATSLANIKQGKWCGKCAKKKNGDQLRGSIDAMQEIAEKRGGKCLSKKYKNSQEKLKFSCVHGHIFEKTPHDINRGSWCPQCNGFMGEEICRWYLEHVYQTKFKKAYPNWLRKNNRQFHLDGLCEDLRIAFEHHGNYHYTIDRKYSKTLGDVKKRQAMDALKMSLCAQHGIKVIIIPEIFQLTPVKELPMVILRECLKKDIPIPKHKFAMDIDVNGAYKLQFSEERLTQLKKIANMRGGESLATVYLGNKYHLSFRCKFGHVFSALPTNILRSHWCAKCAKNHIYDLKIVEDFALEHGAKCLSKEYINCKKTLQWQCNCGNIFSASFDGIRWRKYFCLVCKKERSDFDPKWN